MRLCRDEKRIERYYEKSVETLFIDGIQAMDGGFFDVELFQRSANMGHEESRWIMFIGERMKNPTDTDEAIDVFANTQCGIGWYFAGILSEEGSLKRRGYLQQSSEAGYSWGQVAYTNLLYEEDYTKPETFTEEKEKYDKYLKRLIPSVEKKNPYALYLYGYLLQHSVACIFTEDDYETLAPDYDPMYVQKTRAEAEQYFLLAAKLGWSDAIESLANIHLCRGDVLQSIRYSKHVKESEYFYRIFRDTHTILRHDNSKSFLFIPDTRSFALENIDVLIMELGYGTYWKYQKDECHECLNYYCAMIDLQQAAIFTFLLCWKKVTFGIKGPGAMIGKMVWDGRYDHPIQTYKSFIGGIDTLSETNKKIKL